MKRFDLRRDGLSLFALLAFFLLWQSSCQQPAEPIMRSDGQGCGLHLAMSNTAEIPGAMDWNANYMGFIAPVRAGERMTIQGEFPRSRYASFVLYDQDFMPIDALTDYEIVPLSGENPFLPGAPRNPEPRPEFELTVLMQGPPAGERAPNTLYAGRTYDDKPNRVLAVVYRAYLNDQGYAYEDGHPLAVFGGVEPPLIQLFDKRGRPYCPNNLERSLSLNRAMSSALWANRRLLKNPVAALGGPANPPVWLNTGSEQGRSDSTLVPNRDTVYIATVISREFGELLVLRFKPARTPEQSYYGEPFPESSDMRYWSLSMNHVDTSRTMSVFSDKTLADFEVPALGDGTRQLVIGFKGVSRPQFVPAEQWVGMDYDEGFIIMRNIVITPEYPGNLRKMPPGPITGDNDRFTPGGVYCSAEELKLNPELGLTRKSP